MNSIHAPMYDENGKMKRIEKISVNKIKDRVYVHIASPLRVLNYSLTIEQWRELNSEVEK